MNDPHDSAHRLSIKRASENASEEVRKTLARPPWIKAH
jgi:hypothetical protein